MPRWRTLVLLIVVVPIVAAGLGYLGGSQIAPGPKAPEAPPEPAPRDIALGPITVPIFRARAVSYLTVDVTLVLKGKELPDGPALVPKLRDETLDLLTRLADNRIFEPDTVTPDDLVPLLERGLKDRVPGLQSAKVNSAAPFKQG
ncbi:hypothetical protein [Thioclava sp. F36-7]|uniref:hypothetical protein n=1 Tax=Thioclava sp. F36-7 TaxID=1915317 RepID=UPI00117E1C09|nr:hypothetical protein [Thioclava sp. F36-7]